MNGFLPLPDVHLAQRLLAPVSYPDRLEVGRLVPPVGLQQSYVRGLPEILQLLAPQSGSLPAINLKALAEWVDRVLGDLDLAHMLVEIAGCAPNYVSSCVQAHDWVARRLDQARRVLESGTV